jgi:hypothetical protein
MSWKCGILFPQATLLQSHSGNMSYTSNHVWLLCYTSALPCEQLCKHLLEVMLLLLLLLLATPRPGAVLSSPDPNVFKLVSPFPYEEEFITVNGIK